MKENGFVNLFLRHLGMAIPWGIVFLAVLFIAATGLKQQAKETIQYAAKIISYGTLNAAEDYHVMSAVKKNAMELIDFASTTAKNEVKDLLQDPRVKSDLKEILESCRKEKN